MPIREVYAAAHIVTRRDYNFNPGKSATVYDIDWEKTLRYREYLWSLGFGVAEAMDTAQRGNEVGWDVASRLLDMTLTAAKDDPAGRRVIGGAGADLVINPQTCSLEEVIDSYTHQIKYIQERGGTAIIFPNNILPERFPIPNHYMQFIKGIAEKLDSPVYLHWLGKYFNPKMAKYWGFEDITKAAREVVLPLMTEHADKIMGIKLSTLDQDFEEWFRQLIWKNGQAVLTGDDFNFTALIEGKDRYQANGKSWSPRPEIKYSVGDYSHALLGIFDGIAPVAAKALQHLAKNEVEKYRALMKKTETLSRHIFSINDPERVKYYKVGLVFLAYLNGHQDHFKLLGGIEAMMDNLYLTNIFKLADQAGLLNDTRKAYTRYLRVIEARDPLKKVAR